MPMIETDDGTALYFKEWGEGPAVVLVHGWPLSADSWDDVALALADAGYRVISYDRRGFGRSDQPWSGYDYDTFADDLAGVIEVTEAEDPVIVGFSMGGGEVARFLSRHGGASKAVLIASVVPFMLQTDDHPAGAPQAVFDGMKAGIRADRPAFLKGFLQQFYGGQASDAVAEHSFQVALQAGLKGTLDCIDAFSGTDFRPDLDSFTIPTLIIHGTADAIVPIDISGRAAAAGMPHAQMLEIDGGPHGLLASHKDQVIAALLDFLAA